MVDNIIGTLLGFIFIAIGVFTSVASPIASILIIIIGITFIPIFRTWLKKKTNKNISFESRRLLYGILFVVLIVVYFVEQAKIKQNEEEAFKEKRKLEQQEYMKKMANLREEKKELFKVEKNEIINKIKKLKKEKKYQNAMSEIKKYDFIEDKDLLAIKKEIRTIIDSHEIEKETKRILAELKKLPASKVSENHRYYEMLLKMHPNNKRYKSKEKYYGDKLIAMQAQAAAEKIFFGKQPQASAWDGSYYEVERYLKSVMKDPDSLKMNQCSSVYKIKNKGWGVKCSYRGRNSFGAMVLNANWFIIRNNQVVDVQKHDAYN